MEALNRPWTFLNILCDAEGETDVWIRLAHYITAADTKVLWRVDSGRVWEGDFVMRPEGPGALYAPDAVSFARAFVGGNQLAFAYFPPGEGRTDLFFDLTGAAAPVTHVADTCGWNP